jgi:hypothetical protein
MVTASPTRIIGSSHDCFFMIPRKSTRMPRIVMEIIVVMMSDE